jgi:hypothetical protein
MNLAKCSLLACPISKYRIVGRQKRGISLLLTPTLEIAPITFHAAELIHMATGHTELQGKLRNVILF